MGWEDLTPSAAVENADWIGPRLHPFAQDVGSVLPAGFAAYARILHPAWEGGGSFPIEVNWSEVATWSGKTIHPEVQFHAIAAALPDRESRPKPWTYEPRNGVLSERQVRAMIELLSKHTTTPNACWFCLWEGYGYFNPGAIWQVVAVKGSKAGRWLRLRAVHLRLRLRKLRPRHLPSARVTLPQRGYLLFTGPLTKAAGWEDGPNLWWPDDRAWFIASEIDLPYSYVGGSNALIKDVLAHPALEALPADIGDGITYDSDKLNSSN